MNQLSIRKSLRTDTRGAAMVEYALLLCVVLAAASQVMGHLGKSVSSSFKMTTAQFSH